MSSVVSFSGMFRRDLGGALQKQLCHLRMTADRIAIFPNLTVSPCRDFSSQLQLARNDRFA